VPYGGVGDERTSGQKNEKIGGAVIRNRLRTNPPRRPQHPDCSLRLIDIQMLIPERLGSIEIVHGQLSLDCGCYLHPVWDIPGANRQINRGYASFVFCVRPCQQSLSPPGQPNHRN
jgi:hypothetical protein